MRSMYASLAVIQAKHRALKAGEDRSDLVKQAASCVESLRAEAAEDVLSAAPLGDKNVDALVDEAFKLPDVVLAMLS